MHVLPQTETQFVFLALSSGHDVLVIRSIADMSVDEEIRIEQLKDLGKRFRISRIAFEEVTIQIVVPSVAAKTILPRPILIGPCPRVAVQSASDVIERYDRDDHIL